MSKGSAMIPIRDGDLMLTSAGPMVFCQVTRRRRFLYFVCKLPFFLFRLTRVSSSAEFCQFGSVHDTGQGGVPSRVCGRLVQRWPDVRSSAEGGLSGYRAESAELEHSRMAFSISSLSVRPGSPKAW
jgi:hypothetical protein